jgi:hypothetical protein
VVATGQSSILHGVSGEDESVQGGAAQRAPHFSTDQENGLQQTQGADVVKGASSQHERANVVQVATSPSQDEGVECIQEQEIHMYEKRFVARLGREGNVFSPQYVRLTAGFHHPDLLKRLL